MMRIYVTYGVSGIYGKVKDRLEVEDDATDEEIEEYVGEYVTEQLNWGWRKEREAE